MSHGNLGGRIAEYVRTQILVRTSSAEFGGWDVDAERLCIGLRHPYNRDYMIEFPGEPLHKWSAMEVTLKIDAEFEMPDEVQRPLEFLDEIVVRVQGLRQEVDRLAKLSYRPSEIVYCDDTALVRVEYLVATPSEDAIWKALRDFLRPE